MRGLIRPLDRNVLMLPEVILDSRTFDADADVDVPLRPLLDWLWQAFGEPSCWDYNEAGRWQPPRR